MLHLDDITGVLAGIVHRTGRRTPNTIAELSAFKGRGIEEMFPAPQTVPAPQIVAKRSLGGLERSELVFPSEYRPLASEFAERYRCDYERLHTVYVRRVRPRERNGGRPRRRLIYVHGYMQPETPLEELTLLTSMALLLDVEVLQVQLPHHGRRRARGSRFDGELYWSADLVRSLEAFRQTIFDVRHLLGYLQGEDGDGGDGPAIPVGISGISLGGTVACALCCLDDRFDFAAPMIAHADLAAVTADAPVLGRLRRELRKRGYSIEQFAALLDSFGWYDLRPRMPAERILLLAAKADHFFPRAKLEAMWREWGQPPIDWFSGGHIAFIPQLPLALRAMRRHIDGLYEGPRS